MNSRPCLTAMAFFLALSLAEQASAFYAPHMGRFTSRDPNGETGRIGMEPPPNAAASATFVDRDRFDPMAQYADGMNLYQYVQSGPTTTLDPFGLETLAPPAPVELPSLPWRPPSRPFPLTGGGSAASGALLPATGLAIMTYKLCKSSYDYNQPVRQGYWPRKETPEEQEKRCLGTVLVPCLQWAHDRYHDCMIKAQGDPKKEAECWNIRRDDTVKCDNLFDDCNDGPPRTIDGDEPPPYVAV